MKTNLKRYNKLSIISEVTERIGWSDCLKMTDSDDICSRFDAKDLDNTFCDVLESRLSATVDSTM